MALHVQDAVLHFGLIAGLSRPGRHDGDPVMAGHRAIGRVEVRFVPARFGNGAPKIVADHDGWTTLNERERARMGHDPLGQTLRPGGFHVGVVARAQHGDKDLGLPHLARGPRYDRHRLPGIIHEHLLAGLVGLPHPDVQAARPAAIMLAKLGVLVALRVLLLVLLPQKLERDALALEFLMNPFPIRQGTFASRCRYRGLEQERLQLTFIQVLGQRPGQACPSRPNQIFAHRRDPDPATAGDGSMAQAAFPFQSKHFFDLTHGQSPSWHRCLLHSWPPWPKEAHDTACVRNCPASRTPRNG